MSAILQEFPASYVVLHETHAVTRLQCHAKKMSSMVNFHTLHMQFKASQVYKKQQQQSSKPNSIKINTINTTTTTYISPADFELCQLHTDINRTVAIELSENVRNCGVHILIYFSFLRTRWCYIKWNRNRIIQMPNGCRHVCVCVYEVLIWNTHSLNVYTYFTSVTWTFIHIARSIQSVTNPWKESSTENFTAICKQMHVRVCVYMCYRECECVNLWIFFFFFNKFYTTHSMDEHTMKSSGAFNFSFVCRAFDWQVVCVCRHITYTCMKAFLLSFISLHFCFIMQVE